MTIYSPLFKPSSAIIFAQVLMLDMENKDCHFQPICWVNILEKLWSSYQCSWG